MQFKALHLGALAAAAALTASTTAQAAVTLQSYRFTATSIVSATTQSGTFTLAHDDLSGAYSLFDLDFTLGETVFDTSNSGLHQTNPFLRIGGLANGPGGIGPEPDFLLQISLPKLETAFLTYRSADGDATDGGAATLERLPSAVPEPATWAMMIVGFGAAGTLLRRRARTLTPRAARA